MDSRQAQLQIHYLGRFDALCFGSPLPGGESPEARSLLKVLAAERQPLARNTLLALLWPDEELGVASQRLELAVDSLNRTLASLTPGYLAVQLAYGRYFLDPALAVWADADAFEAQVIAALNEEKRGQTSEAIAHYERAIALYQGDYLPNDRDADWTLLRRESLKDQYLLALARLADYRFLQGDLTRAIRYYRRILRRDPCREDAYTALIQGYLRLGHRDKAAHWSRRCVRVLRKRLDSAPSKRIRFLSELPGERELIHA